MRVGIIAEGKSDRAVIENILCSVFGIDRESIQPIRPSDGTDETDLQQQKLNKYSNCALVKQECLERSKIRDFFSSPVDEGERLLVIHVDTAEIGRPNTVLQSVRPPKTPPARKSKKKAPNVATPVVPPYADTLRNNVIAEIDGWLQGQYKSQIRYAIAIEETEAWVLALYVDHDTVDHDTVNYDDPKKALHDFLNRPNGMSKQQRSRHFNLDEYDRFDELSRGFRRKKTLLEAAANNRSLELFVASL